MSSLDNKRAAGQPDSKQELMEGSPTLKAILSGQAPMKFLSKFSQDRTIGGKVWHGENYGYNIDLPHPTKPGKKWLTTLTVWHPDARSMQSKGQRDEELPETQLTILTGHGEMEMTDNKEVRDLILKEISRQMGQADSIPFYGPRERDDDMHLKADEHP